MTPGDHARNQAGAGALATMDRYGGSVTHEPRVERSANTPTEEVQQRCLRRVEMALARGNEDECIAAIESAFNDETTVSTAITMESSVAELPISPRTANALQGSGIETVSHLCGLSAGDILAIPNMGKAAVREIREAIRQFGFVLRNE